MCIETSKVYLDTFASIVTQNIATKQLITA